MYNSDFSLDDIDAIIFDLGGVILNLDYDLTVNAFKRLGQSNFDKLYTQANQDKIFDSFETGQISSNQFIKYMLQFLPKSISQNDVVKAWNLMLLDLPKERIHLLNELKKTKRIFLFSNTNEIHFEAFKNQMEMEFGNRNLLEDTFEQTYFSHLEKVRKPNKEAFTKVINEQGLENHRTLFIDDSIQHIEGARKLGIRAIHLIGFEIQDLFS
jgi:putative hydrolase of the HAD superfamily